MHLRSGVCQASSWVVLSAAVSQHLPLPESSSVCLMVLPSNLDLCVALLRLHGDSCVASIVNIHRTHHPHWMQHSQQLPSGAHCNQPRPLCLDFDNCTKRCVYRVTAGGLEIVSNGHLSVLGRCLLAFGAALFCMRLRWGWRCSLPCSRFIVRRRWRWWT